MPRFTALIAPVLMFPSLSQAGQHDAEARRILDLAGLTAAPACHPAPGFTSGDGIRPVFFEGLPWKGNPTRVFAWLGLPEQTPGAAPGIVLVHGGGGTAFREWVARWNARGYAAISIAVEGQTDVRRAGETDLPWQRHKWAGPPRPGIYGDSDEPLRDQWMYHAVADTILANSLLRSMAGVDPDKVGIMGISWGGVITSTAIGIDTRFAFAIPAYGCGGLADADNEYGRSLANNPLYREAWDPVLRLGRAAMPTLWLSWTGDGHFPLDCQASSYRAVAGPRMISLIPGMGHGHESAWEPEDSYAFADSVVRESTPWCLQTGIEVEGGTARVRFSSTRPIGSAVLTSTTGSGPTGERSWSDSPASIHRQKEGVVVEATIPEGTTGWFLLLESGGLHACSDYQVVDTAE